MGMNWLCLPGLLIRWLLTRAGLRCLAADLVLQMLSLALRQNLFRLLIFVAGGCFFLHLWHTGGHMAGQSMDHSRNALRSRVDFFCEVGVNFRAQQENDREVIKEEQQDDGKACRPR